MVKPQVCEYGRADTISRHFGGGMGVGYMPSSSLPITVLGRSLNDPVVIEVGVISDPHQLQHLAEQVLLLTVSVQMWVSQPQSCKYRRALPISHLSCCCTGRRALPFYPITCPSISGAGGRSDPVIIRAGKLYWTTTSCKTQESTCTSPG